MFITSKAKNDAVFAVAVQRAVRVAFAGVKQATSSLVAHQRDIRVAFDSSTVGTFEPAGKEGTDPRDDRSAGETACSRRTASTRGNVEWVRCAADFPCVMPLWLSR